jgi:urea carboxylase-associated protein 2
LKKRSKKLFGGCRGSILQRTPSEKVFWFFLSKKNCFPSSEASSMLYKTVLPGGAHWSFTMRRGSLLTLTDIAGSGNAGMLLFNAAQPLERYNAPDTLKCQHSFFLTASHCLYSDMGRILCSIVADDVGWHDTACGTSNAAMIERQFGPSSYQKDRNDRLQNGRHAFLTEAAKYGLGRRDMAANINWFSKVAVDDDGNMAFVAGNSRPGASVSLRFEMDTLVLLHACPHPLDPATLYPRQPIGVAIGEAPAMAADDACLNAAPENARGFTNTALYHQHPKD